ncbi:hypothetical protein Pcinc_028623 [Petrolisthes cinctipes]|uniref:Uncharacterized protein n=1 Tax=Petrolisthes cinctipes TaxID=88211 RepID=A0AAE1F3A2_PETCI|nr:hypothetical protein Pcinc_028623 [Petrolisthes cinctipes]
METLQRWGIKFSLMRDEVGVNGLRMGKGTQEPPLVVPFQDNSGVQKPRLQRQEYLSPYGATMERAPDPSVTLRKQAWNISDGAE